MPVIEVKMFAGRSHEQKAELAQRITAVAMDVLDVKAESVRVIIQEVPKEHWAIAGKLVSDAE